LHPTTSPLFPYTTLFRSDDPVRRGLFGLFCLIKIIPNIANPSQAKIEPNTRNIPKREHPMWGGTLTPAHHKIAGFANQRLRILQDRKSTRLNSSHLVISY